MGYVLEYLEWWGAVQVQVPHADHLLRGLVSTFQQSRRDNNTVRWQAGFAQSQVPLRSGSWVLEDVDATPCRYACLMDAGRRPQTADDRSTVRDDSGHCYRAIRRHIFRRYVRRHRACLARLARLDRDELLSLVAEGVCATCLAYVVWRMSIENVIVLKGLFLRRTTNYRLRLTEPWPGNPSDDPTRLAFTYMQFFGIWAGIVNRRGFKGLQICMQDTVTEAQVVYATDPARPADAPLEMLHCLYPDGDALTIQAGRPCRQPWRLLPYERQCEVRTLEWLAALTPPPKPIFQLYLETDPNAVDVVRRLYV
ncbi:hypothetical protein [Massilia sp. YMA4]|uniref:hypothetical protein n=1 Tax=Massilia sp. YMA4 TaxID=1593482 RepID=UPI000DD1162B|nr:hypothetical protein [Massilia sp. YMA4]AXA90819.1 hypothetical protein DPH57_06360 [Massilia sp. YMA4]